MEGIVIRNLCKFFAGKPALWDSSVALPVEQVTSLMAPSGADKTTLLRILTGLKRPDGDAIDGPADLWLGAVFRKNRLRDNLDLSINIRLINPTLGWREMGNALAVVELAGCLRQPAREFSGGMHRRAAILRVPLAKYDLLFLDEPFKGLGQETEETMIVNIRRRCAGWTVLLVTHGVAELDAMDAVARLGPNI